MKEPILCPVCVTPLVPFKNKARLGNMKAHKNWMVCPDCGYVDSQSDYNKANDEAIDIMKERQKKFENSIDSKYENNEEI